MALPAPNGLGKTLRTNSGPCNVVLRPFRMFSLGQRVQPATMIGFKQIEFFDHTGTGRTPFAGNLIPQDRMDPIVQKIIALIPPPTFPDRLTNNFYASGPFMFDRHTLDNKVNWHVSEKLSTFARFSWLKYNMSNQQSFGNDLGGPPVSDAAGNPGKGFGGTWSSTLAATYILKPTFIIDAYFGYTLMDTNVEQPRLDEKIGLDFLGIPGTNR